MTPRKRAAVLISGRGSNLAALIDASKQTDYPAEICLVISNVPGAGGIDHARANGIPAAVVDHRGFSDKGEFEAALNAKLSEARADLVCLAGFMRLLSPAFVHLWLDRLINIHPSLLPCFPGLRTHERALEAGVKIHGATVHFVRVETDTGPIIAQGAVPVLAGDDAETLGRRVLSVEHQIYPLALARVARGEFTAVSGRVRVGSEAAEATLIVA